MLTSCVVVATVFSVVGSVGFGFCVVGCVVDGEATSYGKLEDETVRDLLLKYQAYQYANMFDKTVDRALFIGPVAQAQ